MLKVLVNISAEAEAAIRSKASQNFKSDAIACTDGTWDVPLQPDTIERLKAVAFEGETISDTIIRLICGGRPS